MADTRTVWDCARAADSETTSRAAEILADWSGRPVDPSTKLCLAVYIGCGLSAHQAAARRLAYILAMRLAATMGRRVHKGSTGIAIGLDGVAA